MTASTHTGRRSRRAYVVAELVIGRVPPRGDA
jgi:hypothetical protein